MKVALVHDWLTGMRGGEKCLEVFCELYPDADLYTLVYTPENVSATIRRLRLCLLEAWPVEAVSPGQKRCTTDAAEHVEEEA